MTWRVLSYLLLMTGITSLGQAAYLQEYFDYGNAAADFSVPRNGGSGWTGPWATNVNMKYQTTNLTYNAPGYDNWGNEAATGSLNGTTTTNLTSRALNGMTGTIWMSFLTQQTAINGDVLFWLNNTAATSGAARDFVALRGSTGTTGTNSPPEPVLSYQGPSDTSNADITSSNTDYAINTTHLVLLKIDMNASGTGNVNDHITFWVNPDLSLGQPSQGTAAYFRDTKDAFDTSLNFIAASFSNDSNSYIDAIRISNEANGFLQVTAIPEPNSMIGCAVMGLVALAGLRRRYGRSS